MNGSHTLCVAQYRDITAGRRFSCQVRAYLESGRVKGINAVVLLLLLVTLGSSGTQHNTSHVPLPTHAPYRSK